jgi:glycosyltransferase involved in cell wall biosynthesis
VIKLSIVIPVYNTAKHILQSLNSITAQINDSIEVIIVDDGSTDNSVAIIEGSFNKELNSGLLTLLLQKNSGVSVARNKAIQHARGEYIAFIDADDFILPGYIEQIISNIDAHKPDIIEFGYKPFAKEKEINSAPELYSYQTFGHSNIEDVIDEIYIKGLFYSFLRVIRREHLKGITFPEGVKFCEDVIFFKEVYQRVNTTVHIPAALYAYRINPEGATKNVKPEYISEMVKFYLNIANEKSSYINYLKVNVFFIIYKQHEALRLTFTVPSELSIDRYILFSKICFDSKIKFKKKCILLFPNLFYSIRKIVKEGL